jgi:nucleoside-diphosphate-sugar epimerase
MDYVGDGVTRMARTVIITGASGFLGRHLVEAAAGTAAAIVPIRSPRSGGIDLAGPGAVARLHELVSIADPAQAVLIHAAAVMAWDAPEGFLANAAMALNAARWAREAGVGFSVLVSSVEVYGNGMVKAADDACAPASLYGLGKWAAEQVWRQQLDENRRSIVRLSGIWGWQQQPALFWNTLLLAAARGVPPEPRPVVRSLRSRRNYISAREAAECLLQVGARRMSGLFLGAGRDIVDMAGFIAAVEHASGSRLPVESSGAAGDERIYPPSPELADWLMPFPEALAGIWQSQPEWLLQPS